MSTDQALSDAQTAVRNAERDITFGASSYNPDKAQKNRAAARAALGALEAAQADHPALADLRQRLTAAETKGDEFQVENARGDLDNLRRAAARELTSFGSARERGPMDCDPASAAAKQTEWRKKVAAKLDEHKAALDSVPGKKLAEELDAWAKETDAKIAELQLTAEAFALFRETADVPDYGDMRFLTAMDSVAFNLQRDDVEKVVHAWDAAKKLAPKIQDARYAEVPEIKAALETYAALEKRIAAELKPKLAKLRMGPLIERAESTLELLKRDTDNQDEGAVLRWRKELREKIAPLVRDWGDQPDAQDFLELCERAFRRSEEDLGDKIVIREIEEVEAAVKPSVERLERALARKSVSAVRDHATRLRARLVGLEPFLGKQRAQVLHERATAALGRVESEMGADVARAIAEAEDVLRIDIDISWDANLQEVLKDANHQLAMYREEYKKMQDLFDEQVDMVNGSDGNGRIAEAVESTAKRLITHARDAEEYGDKVKRIDRAHPTVKLIADAAPKLVKRAQAWKELLTRKCAFAEKLYAARSACDSAEGARKSALTSAPEHATSSYGWPSVLASVARADAAVAEAVKILPDDHDEADAWGAKAAALRKEAVEKMTSVCVAQGTRLAGEGRLDGARRYATALKEALPDAPEVAQIEATIAGTADALQKAKAEVRTRADLLASRAAASAQAARAAYDAWAAERKPIVALAANIVGNMGDFRGKFVAGGCSSLGDSFGDEPWELHGEMYQVDYDPAVYDALAKGLARVRDLYKQMVEAVMMRYDVPGQLGTSSGFYPDDVVFLCEIDGTATYTPRHEVRDASGRLLGTVSGNPYTVPRVVVRGLASGYYVIVPGQAPSIDALDASGIVE